MKKIICLICLIPILLLAGCSGKPGYVQTAETEAALQTYYAAVKESIAQTSGKVKIHIHMNDTVVSKAETEEFYEYTYTVTDGKESFDYRCADKEGNLTSHYATNEEGKVIDQIKNEENKDFSAYLVHEKNPISTLSLFRMDANFKVQDSTISAITMEEQDGATVIRVAFHGNKLTGLSIKAQGGLIRNITSHERVYTIREGKIVGIEIHDRENAQYKGDVGTMDTDTVVEVVYS